MRSAWRRRIFCKGGAGVNTFLIAAAAMAGGAALGFSMCWVATRLAAGNHAAAARLAGGSRAATRLATGEKKKMGVMDKVLVFEAVILIAYTIADLVVFWHTGSEPYTLTGCVFGVCGIENGVMGWIKTNKEKQAAEAARTSGSGQTAAPVEPPTEREEPPDAGIK